MYVYVCVCDGLAKFVDSKCIGDQDSYIRAVQKRSCRLARQAAGEGLPRHSHKRRQITGTVLIQYYCYNYCIYLCIVVPLWW